MAGNLADSRFGTYAVVQVGGASGNCKCGFQATPTELEAAGFPAVSAQSLGTGRSMELANDELAKALGSGRENSRG